MSQVYADSFVSDDVVREWCRKFKDGRTDVHDEGGQGHKSVATDDIVQLVDLAVEENRRSTISELLMKFPEVLNLPCTLIITEQMLYRKVCAHWVSQMLIDDHKTRRMAAALEFLDNCNTDGEDFFKSIVTGEETWVQYDTSKAKQQSQQWMHTNSPKRPKKFKRTFNNCKVMATVFWDQKGVLLVEFMQPGTT
ncbi:Histone-lysine N-methyltransferase SETMAR, partial [Stegodyphus mimosarum]